MRYRLQVECRRICYVPPLEYRVCSIIFHGGVWKCMPCLYIDIIINPHKFKQLDRKEKRIKTIFQCLNTGMLRMNFGQCTHIRRWNGMKNKTAITNSCFALVIRIVVLFEEILDIWTYSNLLLTSCTTAVHHLLCTSRTYVKSYQNSIKFQTLFV